LRSPHFEHAPGSRGVFWFSLEERRQMNRFSIRLGAALVAGLVATPAPAQPAGDAAAPADAPPAADATPEATPEGPAAEASISADTTGVTADANAGGKAAKTKNSDKCQNDTSVKWIRRCRPERNMFELGI